MRAARVPAEELRPLRSGTLLAQWVDICERASITPAFIYSGCRKIIRTIHFALTLDDSLQLRHAGYTGNKMRMLERNYLHHESIAVARRLWLRRCEQAKYGSVCLTTFGHFEKGNLTGASPRGSVMGPCIQSVSLTWIDKQRVAVDIFYRTTELYKKFPADLVFIRDVLLEPFHLTRPTVIFHFANVTVHPMYWVTIAPHLVDPVASIQSIKDTYFRNWLIKWTARYVCPEFSRGIQKFSQALRVRKDALERIDRSKLKMLQSYLRDNHPGYRNDATEKDDDDSD